MNFSYKQKQEVNTMTVYNVCVSVHPSMYVYVCAYVVAVLSVGVTLHNMYILVHGYSICQLFHINHIIVLCTGIQCE